MKQSFTLNILRTLLLLLTPVLCAAMLWVCLSEAKGQSLATEGTERHRVKVDVYCHNCDPKIITRHLPKSVKIEQGAEIAVQFAFENERQGYLIVQRVIDRTACPAKMELIFKSSLTTPRAAVKEWVKAKEKPDAD